jgi:RNA polymerase sigma-70 factor, ECF subfamily
MVARSSHAVAPEGRDTDHDLVDRVLAGDREAFTAILERHQRRIFNFVYRMVGDRTTAEDVTQEVFLKAYEALPRFRKAAAFSTWLFRIAHNHCLNVLKERRREVVMGRPADGSADANPVPQIVDPSASAEEVLEQRELQALVHDKLNELTPDYRAILVLRDVQGLSYEEIAAALEIELGTVRSRLHRARGELKEKLRSYLGS